MKMMTKQKAKQIYDSLDTCEITSLASMVEDAKTDFKDCGGFDYEWEQCYLALNSLSLANTYIGRVKESLLDVILDAETESE